MDDNGPDYTDATWQQNPAFSSPDIPITPINAGPPSAKQPSFDPAEPWTDLPLPDGTGIASIGELVDRLRESGIPVRSGKVRRSGLFAKGKANVTLSVPVRLLENAKRLVAKHLAGL